jgi:hypothetical protein
MEDLLEPIHWVDHLDRCTAKEFGFGFDPDIKLLLIIKGPIETAVVKVYQRISHRLPPPE